MRALPSWPRGRSYAVVYTGDDRREVTMAGDLARRDALAAKAAFAAIRGTDRGLRIVARKG